MSDWWIRLDSLDCNDAQELKDETYIMLNGRRVWGPHDMRTGNKRRLGGERLEFDRGDVVTIKLFEQEKRRDDEHIGTTLVRYRDVRAWEESFGNPHAVFSRSGRGFYGSAKYTLWFALGYVRTR